jgi:hypothetical protein
MKTPYKQPVCPVCKQSFKTTAVKRGYEVERIIWKILNSQGYYVLRSAGSRGAVDLIAIREDGIKLIQAKGDTATLRNDERRRLIDIRTPRNASLESWRLPRGAKTPEIEVLRRSRPLVDNDRRT